MMPPAGLSELTLTTPSHSAGAKGNGKEVRLDPHWTPLPAAPDRREEVVALPCRALKPLPRGIIHELFSDLALAEDLGLSDLLVNCADQAATQRPEPVVVQHCRFHLRRVALQVCKV